MKEFESSVSPKGQITLPVEVRRRLGIKAKDKVVITVDGDDIRIVPAQSRLDSIYLSVPALTTALTPQEVRAIARDEHAREAAVEGS
jgi:AbrB family looped-hinge helix DNA binding protein